MTHFFPVAVISLVVCSSAHAAIVGMANLNLDGSYTYEYTIDNTLGSDSIIGFSLTFDLMASEIDWNTDSVALGGDVTVPTGSQGTFLDDWDTQGLDQGATFAQDFFSLGLDADVMAGEMLTGFSFTSDLEPTQVSYFEFTEFSDSDGTVIGPGLSTGGPTDPVIPEPSSTGILILLLSSGFLVRKRLS